MTRPSQICNTSVHRAFVTVCAVIVWQMPSADVSALTRFPKKQTFSLSTRHPTLYFSVPATSLTVQHRGLTVHHRGLTVHHRGLTVHHRSLTIHHRGLTIHHIRATVHTSSPRARHRLSCQPGGRRSPNRIRDLTPSCPTTSMTKFLRGD